MMMKIDSWRSRRWWWRLIVEEEVDEEEEEGEEGEEGEVKEGEKIAWKNTFTENIKGIKI